MHELLDSLSFNPFIQVFYFYSKAGAAVLRSHTKSFNPFIQVFYFYFKEINMKLNELFSFNPFIQVFYFYSTL